MSSGGLRSCVTVPRAELAARRDVEYATNPAIAYEPLLAAGNFYLYIRILPLLQCHYKSNQS